MKTIFMLLIGAGIVGAGVYYVVYARASGPQVLYTTAEVDRGNLDLIIRASGPIEPEEVIDVGAQVNGLVQDFGRDLDDQSKPIDYNSRVEPGTILAHIDDALYQTQVSQAEANLAHSQADVMTAQAKIEQANADLARAKVEIPKHVISQADYDAFVANQKVAVASLAVANAEIGQSQAALKQAKINLNYTIIQSPVKGTIITRRVNIGQTVVSSLSAPSLFLIARDLKRMQIWASVNEADIGQIHPDQDVQFTVDAYPDRIFQGKVTQIRQNANMTQNVVTYTVVITTDNSDLKLLPYQTANVQFDAGKHHDILRVANAALRWRPQVDQVAPDAREAYANSQKARGAAAGGAGGGSANSGGPPTDLKAEKARRERGRLWMVDGDFVRSVQVKIGVTDGAMTEIVSGDIKEADRVITGEDHSSTADSGTQNPFAPKLFGGAKKKE